MLTDDFMDDHAGWAKENAQHHRRILSILAYDEDEQRAYVRTYDLLHQTYESGIAALHALAAADGEEYEIVALEESLMGIRGTIGMLQGRVCAQLAINVAPEGFGRRLTVTMYAPAPPRTDEDEDEDDVFYIRSL
jgi:hypothetical protein